jgi:murein hydrolase activator
MILRPDPRLVLGPALAVVLPIGADLGALAQTPSNQIPPGVGWAPAAQIAPYSPAQTPPPSPSPPASGKADDDALKAHDQELDAARAAQHAAAENEAKLKLEIESLGDDRRALNQQLIDTAARVRTVEASIEATQTRLQPLDEQEKLFEKSLAERRSAIVEILAALQQAGRQPPPALLVQPEDALRAVRTAIALGTVLPDMRAEVDALSGDLNDLIRVRKEIVGEREHLSSDLVALARDQLRLNLLIDERQKKQAVAEQALDSEHNRAADLARQVDNLQDLIAKLESAPHDITRPAEEGGPSLAALNDPGRLTPAVAFASTRGHLRLPVNGVKIRAYGAPDGSGGTQKGLSIAARPGAQITSPCDGWVVYAGRFRSYGQLLILNAGGGYHILLAGMERISVDLGQFVLTGEPVAVMGGGSQVSGAAAARSKPPVLYVEFRKDGTPIDPGPWWAANESEKVRG